MKFPKMPRMPRMPKNISKILENKYVLYIVAFISAATLLGYLVIGNIKAVIFFILVGYLVYHFNKNMVITLIIPLILTSILVAGKTITEGLETMNPTQPTSTLPTNPTQPTSTLPTNTNTPPKNPTAANGSSVPAKQPTAVPHDMPTPSSTATTPPTLNSQAATTIGASPVVQNIKSNIQKEPANTSESMSTMKKGGGHRVDYAATVEDAYDDLNKILGGDGIQRLTNDTQKLMGQQVKLAEAMKNMTPLMEQAKQMMQGLDLSSLGNIGNMAKQFGLEGPKKERK
jgi:cytoskeletal protein RodZ